MKKTSKIIIGIIVLAVVFWGGVKLLGTKDEKTKEPIKIGAILPLTGPASFVGEGMSYAIQIAAEEINRQGGIGGREIQLILENSMSEGKTAVSAIQKLINVDKIDLLIGGSTYEMMAISPIAEQNKIPIITPCSSKPMVTENNNYVFRLMASDSIQANWAANVSYNFLKKKKVAVIYTNDEWGVGFLNEFKNKFTSLGGAIVQEESFNKGDRDLKIQLIKIKNINPEMVLFLGVEAETILGFKQMKELNINMPVLGGASWSNLTIWKELKEIGDGSLYVKARPISNDEFNKKYESKSGSSQVPVCALEAYDTLYVFKEAIVNSDTFDKEKIMNELYKVKIKGVSGDINFNSTGDRFPIQMSLFKVENSKSEEILTQ